MMNALLATNLVAGFLYGIFIDSTYLCIYFAVLIPFIIVSQFFMRDLKSHTKRKGTQIATWGHPTDPSAYIIVDFHTEASTKYVAELNKDLKNDPNRKVTFNHIMVKAVAWGAWKQRRDWGRIVFGFFKPCKEMGVTVLCDQGGKDLVPVTIWNAHDMTVPEIALYLNNKVYKAKTGTDKEF